MEANNMKKICIMIGSRANYSSIKSFLENCKKNKIFEIQIVLFSSASLHRFGNLEALIKRDGFRINHILESHIEGENLSTMVRSTALSMLHIPEIFKKLKPHMVLTIGDRYETLATSISAAYMNIPLIHTMGGEVTGTIDEKIRHATTKLADIHFPASMDAKKRIIKLGEEKNRVFMVGCPRIDLVRKVLKKKINYKYLNKFIDNYGVGNTFDLKKGFCLVSYHPVTTEYSFLDFNIKNILNILSKLKLNSIILWPNSDAGADKISADIRKFREKNKNLKNFKFIINLPVEIYIHLMNLTQCLIGNSSSGIREGSYIGTPVVDIGNRQKDREKGNNVINVKSNDIQALEKAIKFQINKKRYNSLNIYGDGHSSNKIIKVLKKINLKSHKRITY